MAKLTDQNSIDLALDHHQAGRLREAEQIYREILARQPDHVVATHYLGVISHQEGQVEVGLDLIRKAVALEPDYAEAHIDLGSALKASGRLDEAIDSYRQVSAHDPSYPEAQLNLGVALNERGQPDEAVAAFRRVIDADPGFPQAHYNLATILSSRGHLDDALAAYRQAVAVDPSLAEAFHGLANILADRRQLDEAAAAYRSAITLRPDFAEAHCNLGLVLRDKGLIDDAIAACRRAIDLRPDFAEAYNHLGLALTDKGDVDEALAAYRRVIALKPDHFTACNNFGNVLKDSGLLDEAIASYRQAIATQPGYTVAHNNLVYSLYFHPDSNAADIAREQHRWSEQHAMPVRHFIKPHSNDALPGRRLKVGYVSPDFRDHVVGRNLMPLFREHDREHFEVFCYSNALRPDEFTSWFRSHCDGWRDIAGLDDERAAELIREDRIDILVDLTLHMARGRLMVFARKPAPVQVTFAGYPGSTGLDTIDYRLTDPWLDPLGSGAPLPLPVLREREGRSAGASAMPADGESLYSEQPIRLPDTFWCYDPAVMTEGTELAPQAGPLPAAPAGTVTFGCLNNFCKVNELVLALWARVLKAVDGSRLILMTPGGSALQRTLNTLNRLGIGSARVEFVPKLPTSGYLAQYRRIDIVLDTFPYNGHTTSLDALWMGVPVVTLVGKTVVGRAGLSQLTNLGLTELVAESEDQFVQIAADLAGDLPRLSALRAGLRQRMRASPLTDAPKFAGGIEAAYRQIWRTWFETRG